MILRFFPGKAISPSFLWTGEDARHSTSSAFPKVKPPGGGGFQECAFPRKLLLRGLCLRRFRFGGVALGVLAAEALDAAGRIHELLLAGKERVAGGADFYADVALMSGTGDECVAAGAMHADLTIVGMDGCFRSEEHTSELQSRQYL